MFQAIHSTIQQPYHAMLPAFDAASTTKPIGTLTCDGSPWMWKSQGKGHGLPRKTILKCWVFMGFRHLQ